MLGEPATELGFFQTICQIQFGPQRNHSLDDGRRNNHESESIKEAFARRNKTSLILVQIKYIIQRHTVTENNLVNSYTCGNIQNFL